MHFLLSLLANRLRAAELVTRIARPAPCLSDTHFALSFHRKTRRYPVVFDYNPKLVNTTGNVVITIVGYNLLTPSGQTQAIVS